MTRYNVHMVPGIDIYSTLKAMGGVVIKTWPALPDCANVELPENKLSALHASPQVMSVTLDTEVSIVGAALQETSLQEYEGSWGVRWVRAPEVHAGGNTGVGIRVVVMDTGGDLDHQDLLHAGGTNYVTPGTPPEDDHGHGTHVHGIIAALIGNPPTDASNVVGVAPAAKIYHMKVLNGAGSGQWSTVVDGIQGVIELTENGTIPVVVNSSFGGSVDPGSVLEMAYQAATDVGCKFVTSAGNNGAGDGDTVGYPALFTTNVAVASIDETGLRSSFSSVGPAVEVTAPGGNILSTTFDGGYGVKSGTSMAAPHVAGCFALAMAVGVTDPRAAIPSSTDRTSRDNEYGYGILDAVKLVAANEPGDPPPGEPVYDKNITLDGSTSTAAEGRTILAWEWRASPQDEWINYARSVLHTSKADGYHTIGLRVTDSEGEMDVVENTIYVKATVPLNPPTAHFTVRNR